MFLYAGLRRYVKAVITFVTILFEDGFEEVTGQIHVGNDNDALAQATGFIECLEA
ncbi:hypothetical protein D3C81_2180390 [compost metagenome]